MTEPGPFLTGDDRPVVAFDLDAAPSPRRRRRQLGRLLAVTFAFELAVAAEVGLLAGAVWLLLRPVLSD